MASSDSDSAYTVERILKQRKRKGVLEYLIRWQGLDDANDTWEPATGLQNCTDIIASFVKMMTPGKSPKKPRSKSRSRSRSRSRLTKSTSKSRQSRSRSTSRSRTKKDSPARVSKRTEVNTKSLSIREQGRVEKMTQIVKETTDDSKSTEVRKTRSSVTRTEVKTIEGKGDAKVKKRGLTDKAYTLWQAADTTVLIIFVCVSIIALSYVVEIYMGSQYDICKFVSNVFSAVVGALVGAWQCVRGGVGRGIETVINFTRDGWRRVTTN